MVEPISTNGTQNGVTAAIAESTWKVMEVEVAGDVSPIPGRLQPRELLWTISKILVSVLFMSVCAIFAVAIFALSIMANDSGNIPILDDALVVVICSLLEILLLYLIYQSVKIVLRSLGIIS